MLPTRWRRLLVLAVALATLSAFATVPAVGAAQADRPSKVATETAAAKAAAPRYTLAPACVERFSHTHLFNKHVHMQNLCGSGTQYVKVIIAYGPDSGCIRLVRGASATHSWNYGWPYALSRFDRLELC